MQPFPLSITSETVVGARSSAAHRGDPEARSDLRDDMVVVDRPEEVGSPLPAPFEHLLPDGQIGGGIVCPPGSAWLATRL